MTKKKAIDNPFAELYEKEGLLPTEPSSDDANKKAKSKPATKKAAAKKTTKRATKASADALTLEQINTALQQHTTQLKNELSNELATHTQDALSPLQQSLSAVQTQQSRNTKSLQEMMLSIEKFQKQRDDVQGQLSNYRELVLSWQMQQNEWRDQQAEKYIAPVTSIHEILARLEEQIKKAETAPSFAEELAPIQEQLASLNNIQEHTAHLSSIQEQITQLQNALQEDEPEDQTNQPEEALAQLLEQLNAIEAKVSEPIELGNVGTEPTPLHKQDREALETIQEALDNIFDHVADLTDVAQKASATPQTEPSEELADIRGELAQIAKQLARIEAAEPPTIEAPPATEVSVDTSAFERRIEELLAEHQLAVASKLAEWEQHFPSESPSLFGGQDVSMADNLLPQFTAPPLVADDVLTAAVPAEAPQTNQPTPAPQATMPLDREAIYRADREAHSRNIGMTIGTVLSIVIICGLTLLIPRTGVKGGMGLISFGHLGLVVLGIFSLRWLGLARVQIERRIADHERHMKAAHQLSTTLEPFPAFLNIVFMMVLFVWWLVLYSFGS